MKKIIEKIFKKRGEFKIHQIPISLITSNPYQVREKMEKEDLENLAKSIKRWGLLQPIAVRKDGGKYQIIAGERRYEAIKICGQRKISAIVYEFPDSDMRTIAFLENIQRKDLSLWEEIDSYRQLINEFETLTCKELSEKIGLSEESIKKKVELIKLPPLLQRAMSEGMMDSEMASLISKIPQENLQLKVIEKVYKDDLSLEEVEKVILKMMEEVPGDEIIDKEYYSIDEEILLIRIVEDLREFIKLIKLNKEEKVVEKIEKVFERIMQVLMKFK